MKDFLTSIFLVVLSLVVIACHKTDGVIPQEPFVGTYSVIGKQQIIDASGKTTATVDVNDQVTVSLLAASNQIKISSVNSPDLEAVLINKNSFKIPEQLFAGKTASRNSYSGTGVVVNNQLQLSIDVVMYTDQGATSTRTLTHVEGNR